MEAGGGPRLGAKCPCAPGKKDQNFVVPKTAPAHRKIVRKSVNAKAPAASRYAKYTLVRPRTKAEMRKLEQARKAFRELRALPA